MNVVCRMYIQGCAELLGPENPKKQKIIIKKKKPHDDTPLTGCIITFKQSNLHNHAYISL